MAGWSQDQHVAALSAKVLAGGFLTVRVSCSRVSRVKQCSNQLSKHLQHSRPHRLPSTAWQSRRLATRLIVVAAFVRLRSLLFRSCQICHRSARLTLVCKSPTMRRRPGLQGLARDKAARVGDRSPSIPVRLQCTPAAPPVPPFCRRLPIRQRTGCHTHRTSSRQWVTRSTPPSWRP